MRYFITFLLAVLASLMVGHFTFNSDSSVSSTQETAFDRVIRTGVLRCGYNVWPPALSIDPNSGEVSGIIKELIEDAAAGVNLKVEWTIQAGWGTYAEDLKNDRFDAMCTGVWQLKEVAPLLTFTKPIFYNPVYAYVRADETRINADYSNLNSPKFRIATADGDVSALIAKENFPKAQRTSYGELTHPSEIITNVATKKADLIFIESNVGEAFMNSNPNQIKRLTNEPYKTFSASMLAFKMGEHNLAEMFDTIITEMQLHGTIDRVIEKYDPTRVNFIPVAKPYTIKE